MYKTLFGVLGAFAVVLLLVGLTFSVSSDRPADLTFVNGSEPKTLDPQLTTGEPEGRLVQAVFEGLTRYDAKTLRPVPGVAERWELSADGLVYRFFLRDNALWSDGRPVVAEDFAYAWRRLLDPATGADYAYLLHNVRGAEAFNTYAGYAEHLRQVVLPMLERAKAQPLSASAFQRLLAENNVHACIRPLESSRVFELMAQRDGQVSRAAVEELGALIDAGAGELSRLASEAAAGFGTTLGVFAESPRVLRVELAAPVPYFLQLTSFYPTMPVPRWVVDKPGNGRDWFLADKIVGNGPFLLAAWQVNQRIRLVKSPTYWAHEQVRVQIVDALPVELPTTALNLYLTGAVDWLPSTYPMDLADQLRTRPDFYSGPGLSVYYYRLNTTKKPFDDVRVRRAFNLAIDRDSIVRDVLGLGQLPATGFVPPGMPGYQPPKVELGLDIERARSLLVEAGYAGGRGFPEVGILYNTLEVHRKIAEVIADQLRKNLGVSVTAYNQEWQAYQATTRAGDYAIARAGWVGDYTDPNTFLDMWTTNGGNNQTGFSSALYDRLIAAAANLHGFIAHPEGVLAQLKHPDQARALLQRLAGEGPSSRLAWEALRLQLLSEAEEILIGEELPIIPIYFSVNSGLRSPRLGGFYAELELDDGTLAPNLQNIHPLRDMWILPKAEGGGQ